MCNFRACKALFWPLKELFPAFSPGFPSLSLNPLAVQLVTHNQRHCTRIKAGGTISQSAFVQSESDWYVSKKSCQKL